MAVHRMLEINERYAIPSSELVFTFARSSGPGGQHVNKANTKVTLRWSVANSPSVPADLKQRFVARFRRRITSQGDLLVSSQRFRDQSRNVADCMDKVRRMFLEVVAAPKRRRPSRPTRASRERRLAAKRQRSTSKHLRQLPPRDS